jgi:hypothetical protein
VIDHLVYASTDLVTASADISELLGVAPTPGGSHIGVGTQNALLSLGGATYLEIIGPDPAQPEPVGPRPFGIDALSAPALVAWCVRPSRPLVAVVAAARAAGIDFGAVAAMSRRRPDGVLLEWDLTFPQLDGPFGRALPFLIDWGASPHPTDTMSQGVASQVVRLVGLDIVHPQPDSLLKALDIIGLGAGYEIRQGERVALSARLATPRGDVTLTS